MASDALNLYPGVIYKEDSKLPAIKEPFLILDSKALATVVPTEIIRCPDFFA